MSLYVGDRLGCTCTLDGHLHRVTYTTCIYTIDSPNDGHRGARNMYRIGMYTKKKNCASSWLFTRIVTKNSALRIILPGP